ncbi:MAG TPA: hypothetical protein VNJ10_04520 [Sphingomonas sp.]|nr:hypothetical protein [Sphingomonas sp.]
MSHFHPADFNNTDWHVFQQNRGFIAARERYLDHVKARSAFEARTNYKYYDELGEKLDSEAYRARCKMFAVPAPHAQALCLKLMTALDPKDGSDIDANEELAAILHADARRMA